MRISDWSSDVCSSDLRAAPLAPDKRIADALDVRPRAAIERAGAAVNEGKAVRRPDEGGNGFPCRAARRALDRLRQIVRHHRTQPVDARSEEHTSELQSLMRISYAVFCLKKKKKYEHIDYRHK